MIRMIEYLGNQCKDIVYSNINNNLKKITSAKRHYDYIDIIAGLNEFSKYGKIKTLNDALNKYELGKEKQDLINTMEKYSEQLTICNQKEFETSIKELKDAIKAFENSNLQGIGYVLAVLLPDMERKMGLCNENNRVPLLLRNCKENDMVQQAITIYNELVPRYITTTLGVLEIDKLHKKKNLESERSKLEALIHGMETGNKKISAYMSQSHKKYGKYNHTYYILMNLDEMQEQIKFPKGNREMVINIILDYIQIREIRNCMNHADTFSVNKNKEKEFVSKYFKLPVFQEEKLNLDTIRRSLEEAIKNLERCNKVISDINIRKI